jgi:hypothetical protein
VLYRVDNRAIGGASLEVDETLFSPNGHRSASSPNGLWIRSAASSFGRERRLRGSIGGLMGLTNDIAAACLRGV